MPPRFDPSSPAKRRGKWCDEPVLEDLDLSMRLRLAGHQILGLLQPLALAEQGPILRRQILDDRGEAPPKARALIPRRWQHLQLDEAVELGGDLEAVDGDAIGHDAAATLRGRVATVQIPARPHLQGQALAPRRRYRRRA